MIMRNLIDHHEPEMHQVDREAAELLLKENMYD